MNLKDFLWIIRRRLLWFVSVFVITVAIYSAVLYRERPMYLVSATLSIETPKELSQIPQGAVRGYTPASTLKNWQILVTGKPVKQRTVQELKKRNLEHLLPIVDSITASPVSQETTLTRLTAMSENSDDAAKALNILIETAEKYSIEDATDHLKKAKRALGEQIEEHNKRIPDLDDLIQKLRAEAEAWDIGKKIESTQTALKSYDDQIDTLLRKIQANSHMITKMHKDRAATEHLSREHIPNQVAPSSMMTYEILSRSTPYIDKLQGNLLTLRFSYNTQGRRYKPSHPNMKSLLQEIRDTESELVKTRMEAIGASMDREEANLNIQNELFGLEIESLRKSGEEVKQDYVRLLKIEQRYRPLEREYNDLVSRTSSSNYLLDSLKTAVEAQTGYVSLKEKSDPTEAVLADKKSSKMAPFVVVIAVILAVGFAFMAEFLDTTIKSDVDIKRYLNYPVVGVIPMMKSEPVILSAAGDITLMSEVFDTIATMIHTVGTERQVRSLLITSTVPEEGKTCVSINVAIALARQGKRVTLVDADMRKPAIHQFLRLENTMGFADLLLAARSVDSTATMPSPLELARDVGIPNLKVITSGQLTENPYSLMETQKLAILVKKLEEEADYVIIDTPPLLLTGDALKLAVTTGLVLFVIEAGKTEQKKASWAKHLLTNVGAGILGAVLNKSLTTSEQYYYYYRGHGKYYTKPTP